jgi:hypothetical protein
MAYVHVCKVGLVDPPDGVGSAARTLDEGVLTQQAAGLREVVDSHHQAGPSRHVGELDLDVGVGKGSVGKSRRTSSSIPIGSSITRLELCRPTGRTRACVLGCSWVG